MENLKSQLYMVYTSVFLNTDSKIYIIIIEILSKHLDRVTLLDMTDRTEESVTNNNRSIIAIQTKFEGK